MFASLRVEDRRDDVRISTAVAMLPLIVIARALFI